MPDKIPPFHLAIPVHNLRECRIFYRDIIGCEEGRSSDTWVDFNLYGHQLVLHQVPKASIQNLHYNPVDNKQIPVPHYGVVLPWDAFHEFSEYLRKKEVSFIVKPYIRFQGMAGEQATMFFKDPSGNALEFKSFKDPKQLFAR